MISRKLAVEKLDRFLHKNLGSIPSAILFLDENEGYDTSQFISYINYSSMSQFTFQKAQKYSLKPAEMIVLPISWMELETLQIIPASVILIGLPNLGGRDVKLIHNEFPDSKNIGDIVPWDHVSPWKKNLYSLAPDLDFNKQFHGLFIFE